MSRVVFVKCREAGMLVVKQEAQKLSFREKTAVFLHLLVCKFCRLFVKQNRLINSLAAMAHAKQHTLSAEDKNRMKEGLK